MAGQSTYAVNMQMNKNQMYADDIFIDNGELRKSGRLFSAQEVSQIYLINHRGTIIVAATALVV